MIRSGKAAIKQGQQMGAAAQASQNARSVWGRGFTMQNRLLVSVGVIAVVASAMTCLTRNAQAGGLYVEEFGTPSMGTASAGADARALDASTALHNPAGMARLDDHQLMVAIAPGVADVKFSPDDDSPLAGSDGGQQGGFVGRPDRRRTRGDSARRLRW